MIEKCRHCGAEVCPGCECCLYCFNIHSPDCPYETIIIDNLDKAWTEIMAKVKEANHAETPKP